MKWVWLVDVQQEASSRRERLAEGNEEAHTYRAIGLGEPVSLLEGAGWCETFRHAVDPFMPRFTGAKQ
jgi:hypothetical protein